MVRRVDNGCCNQRQKQPDLKSCQPVVQIIGSNEQFTPGSMREQWKNR
jgi:hypothetical protein